MLQSFMWMCDIPVLWHIAFKEIFRFFYLPYPETGSFVDLMLKKNRHIYSSTNHEVRYLSAIKKVITKYNHLHDFI